MNPPRPPDAAQVRRLYTRFVFLVIVPVVGLVSFGVMAIANERAAVEKRFSQEYAGRLRALAEKLAVTLEVEASRLSNPTPGPASEDVRFDFRVEHGVVQPAGTAAEALPAGLVADLRASAPADGSVALVPVASGPARGLYAVRRAGEALRGLAFREEGLAREVAREGRARFPTDAARFELSGPAQTDGDSSNPVRRLVEEITSDKSEANALSFPLPAPLTEWRITARLPAGDPIRTALWRNRTIYIVVLSLFYGLIITGIIVTLRGIWREVRLSRLKTDFVSNISHELRTPLTSIRMFAETLKLGRAATAEEREQCVDFIMKESERLSLITERTLDWARIEAGRRAYDRQPIAPQKLVGDALETFFAHARVAREDVRVTVEPALPEVFVDPGALGQVLLNLLENAAKYSGAIKQLAVRVRRAGRWVAIDVEDHGIGIARRDLKRIFDRFYRADDLLARRTEGTGLGLSIARRIIDAHGGRIAVHSRVGRGSTFTVELPPVVGRRVSARGPALERAK